MDKKQAKKVKFNLFDALVILVILVAAVAVYLILQGSSDDGVFAESSPISYTVEVTGLREGMEDTVSIGDEFQETSDGNTMGTVTAVEVIPYTVQATDEEEGVIRDQEVEGYSTLRITLEVQSVEPDSAIETTEGETIRVGTSVTMSNGTLLAKGTIIWMEREDAE